MQKKNPPCPNCRRTTDVIASGHRDHFCTTCKITFNHDPENDRPFHRDPAVHAEREDEFAARRRQKFGGKRR